MEDWGAVRDRLARDAAALAALPQNLDKRAGEELAADIRAALERVRDYLMQGAEITDLKAKADVAIKEHDRMAAMLRAAEAEVARLEGLILDWQHREDEAEERMLKGQLNIEARRIRAQREEGKP